MDDPIAALDANVRKKIFQNLFLRKLKGKTRILVTHAVEFLHLVDHIIVLNKGEIIAKGSYQELSQVDYLKAIMKVQELNRQMIDFDDGKSDVSFDEGSSSTPRSSKKYAQSPGRSYSVVASPRRSGTLTNDENREEIKVDFQVYKRYFYQLGGFKVFILLNFIMVSATASKIYADYTAGSWAQTTEQKSQFQWYCLQIFLFSTLASSGVFLRIITATTFHSRAAKIIHQEMITKVMNAPINLFFEVTPIGQLLNKFSRDLSAVDNLVIFSISAFFNQSYQLVYIVAVAIIAVPWLLLFCPVIAILMQKIYKYYVPALKQSGRIESITKSPLLSFFAEANQGVTTIRSFKKQNDFIKKNNELLNQNILSNQWVQGIYAWFAIRMDIITVFVIAITCSFCVIYRSSANPVFLSMMLSQVLTLQKFLNGTIRLLSEFQARMVSVDRIYKLSEIPQEKESTDSDELNLQLLKQDWPQHGKVVFDNVSLKYRQNTEIVLNDLTFEIFPKEKIGIVGRTGAGKSTICLSLSRIMEICNGQILIDGIDINKIDLKLLRQKVTVIPQDPTMFTGTLKFNLDPMAEHSDQEIINLLIEAGLQEVIKRDKEELNQMLTENGQNLSSGEKQLICICRAILRKNKVVILDEATANIDVITEQKIQFLIQKEFQEATVITIAHRINTIIKSDRVIVLSFGEIIEFDQPQILMNDPDSEFSKLLEELESEEETHKPKII